MWTDVSFILWLSLTKLENETMWVHTFLLFLMHKGTISTNEKLVKIVHSIVKMLQCIKFVSR